MFFFIDVSVLLYFTEIVTIQRLVKLVDDDT